MSFSGCTLLVTDALEALPSFLETCKQNAGLVVSASLQFTEVSVQAPDEKVEWPLVTKVGFAEDVASCLKAFEYWRAPARLYCCYEFELFTVWVA